MRKLTYEVAAIVALVAIAGFVIAGEKAKTGDKEKSAGAASCCSASGGSCCAASESASSGCKEGAGCSATLAAQGEKKCPIDLAMGLLPKISYAVGEEKTCCPKAAGELAKKSGAEIHFVVAGKTYDKEADAKLALAEATEKFVSDFVKPKKCSVSGTTTVAGKKIECEKAAAHTAKVVQAAVDNVKLAYLVGDKECHCPIEAKEVAEKTGKQTIYIVGKEKTSCSVTARLNLARAKYRAAVEALVKEELAAKDQETKAGA